MDDRDRRLDQPLPSEDTGDLVDSPADGTTDDFLVAREEGMPYVPPTERVLTQPRLGESGPDQAATAPDDASELSRRSPVTDDEQDLTARAAEALRTSDLTAGNRLRVGSVGSTVYLRGEVESVDVSEELVAILTEVAGVDEVVDETRVRGL
ncbi:MAG TPA: BON domain-containing protein [candidate division Zixibacteria bacterium]|nr:BON domain-containing protein [candidate division Zixibacteria bacterium]